MCSTITSHTCDIPSVISSIFLLVYFLCNSLFTCHNLCCLVCYYMLRVLTLSMCNLHAWLDIHKLLNKPHDDGVVQVVIVQLHIHCDVHCLLEV